MRDSVKETNDTKFGHGLFRSFCLLFIHPRKDDPQNVIKIIGEIYSTTPYHIKEILTAMRVMVVSIGSRGSHIPAMTPRRLRRGVIAGM